MDCPKPGVALRCQVVKVVDGDTIEIEIVRRVRVRLLDCYAPEVRTKDNEEKVLGIASKEHLKVLAEGRWATLLIPTTGARRLEDVETFGRVLGHVWVDGETSTLSEIQVSTGHATT